MSVSDPATGNPGRAPGPADSPSHGPPEDGSPDSPPHGPPEGGSSGDGPPHPWLERVVARAAALSRLFLPGRAEHHRGWVWRVLLLATALVLVAGTVLASLDLIGMPATVVEATTDAIVFEPAAIIDFVALVRPRFGIDADLHVFDGIRLDPPAPAQPFLAALGATHDGPASDSVLVIQRLQVTPTCQVALETMIAGLLRIDIRAVTTLSTQGAAPCAISAEMLLGSPADPGSAQRREAEATVTPARPASLEFRPAQPLVFRRFAITGLGFVTTESGSPESAIRGGVVRLPDHGIVGDTVFAGDALTLGPLTGELTEMHVGDRIVSLFKGQASNPSIAGHRLTPSMLRQLVYWEPFTITLAVLVTVVSVLMAVFQVVLRE